MFLRTTGQRRIPPLARLEGDFLEFKLPVRAFATLTTPNRTSRHRLDQLFKKEWIPGIQAHNRATLGWIMSSENTPSWWHIHAALIAAVPLDYAHAALLWQTMVAPRYSEAARVYPYRDGLCGLGYVLKSINGRSEEIQMSDNITAFAQGSGKSYFRTTSAQRRQARRINAQILQAALEAALAFETELESKEDGE